VAHDFIDSNRFDLQLYFAAADAAEIEQFVDELDFEIDVALHHREVFAHTPVLVQHRQAVGNAFQHALQLTVGSGYSPAGSLPFDVARWRTQLRNRSAEITEAVSVTFMYNIKVAHGHASPTIQSTSILAISTG
jgi:hypothetical protein